MNGCCADKSCTRETCMALDAGRTCSDCVHFRRCRSLLGVARDRTGCDYFPRRFQLRVAATASAPQTAELGAPGTVDWFGEG